LQTPLAIAINKLETLAEGNELTSSQLELLSSAMNNLERLTRLNKSLLLLSRIENNQFELIKPISINQLASDIVDDFKDQAEFSDIRLLLENRQDCKVMMNADLASVLLINLIKNGIVHNIRGGHVNVIVEERFIEVRNSGKAAPLNKNNIFSRFKTSKSSSGSTGLGLSIVAAIAAHYGFKISYSFTDEHIFRIHLT
jgi:signal transduction histidine kinase